jgi:phasin family protein
MTNANELLNDWAKAIAGLDLTKGSEALLSMAAKFPVPGIDMDVLVASQRDNLEALGASNRAALDGFKAVGEWQVKILRETMQELASAINGLAQVGSPQQLAAIETELAKKAFETAVRQMRELADIVTDANQQAADAIVKRIPESIEEIKDVLKLPQAPDAA